MGVGFMDGGSGKCVTKFKYIRLEGVISEKIGQNSKCRESKSTQGLFIEFLINKKCRESKSKQGLNSYGSQEQP